MRPERNGRRDDLFPDAPAGQLFLIAALLPMRPIPFKRKYACCSEGLRTGGGVIQQTNFSILIADEYWTRPNLNCHCRVTYGLYRHIRVEEADNAARAALEALVAPGEGSD